MLHHPFRCPTDLLSFDGHHYSSYATGFYACVRLHTHPDDYYTDVIPDDPDAVQSEYEESDHGECDGPLADFEAFARRRPGDHDLTCTSTDDLGSRDMDRAYDWTSHVSRDVVLPAT